MKDAVDAQNSVEKLLFGSELKLSGKYWSRDGEVMSSKPQGVFATVIDKFH